MKFFLLLISCCLITGLLTAQCTDSGNYWNERWVSCTTSANPNSVRGTNHWVLYEFHENQYIDSSYVWNANRVGESGWGAKDVVIDYSTDGSTWVELGTYVFPQGDETSTYTGFLGPEFGGVFLQKILITVLSTHDGGTCASLGEVQFKIDQTACYGIVDNCGVCDGPGEMTWYIDADGDGLGSVNNALLACAQPSGYVADNTDLCDNGALGWADIEPLFANNGCNGCHGSNSAGGLDLRTFAAASMGGNNCGTDLLTGVHLVGAIMTTQYNGCTNVISLPSMNDRVGGQFDATELATLQAWIDGGAPEFCTDFCEADKTLALDYTSGEVLTVAVSNIITASNTVLSGANITYDAGTQICLESGFTVESGAEFTGMIGGCGQALNEVVEE